MYKLMSAGSVATLKPDFIPTVVGEFESFFDADDYAKELEAKDTEKHLYYIESVS